METGTWKVKTGLDQMLKGRVVMDVVTPEHAKIAVSAAYLGIEAVPSAWQRQLENQDLY